MLGIQNARLKLYLVEQLIPRIKLTKHKVSSSIKLAASVTSSDLNP
jgi:hypothetical protein